MESNNAAGCRVSNGGSFEQALNAGFPEFSEMPEFCADIPSETEDAEIAGWFESSLLSPEIQSLVCDAVKDARVSRA